MRRGPRARPIALAASVALAASLALAAPGAAAAQVQPYGTNDFGGFHNVLPPGTNGLVDAAQLLSFEALGQRPPHSDDQLAMYSNLTAAAPGIQQSQIGQFYKDATFGVPSGDVGSSESPEPGATIIRDKGFAVPHIYGDTRAELMYGIGWATAEDRLFFIDVLRHLGQGDVASFAGGSNAGMDEAVWAGEPYTPQDLQAQVQTIAAGPDGAQIMSDATNYVAGINAYIARAENPLFTATALPAEYVVIGKTPQPFTVDDLVSIATLVGGIFGVGGGGQLKNAMLYESLERRFGPEHRNVAGSPQYVPAAKRRSGKRAVAAAAPKAHTKPVGKVKDHSGFATFLSFDDPADPEAPTTVQGKSFPYQQLPMPTKSTAARVALPDYGSVALARHIVAGALPPGATSGGLIARRSMSNALLVSGAHTASGHPIAVMGPQVAYFAPQILMEEDIHGPGIDADGAAFAGVNLYVELGHGQDYAWSATSAGQNIVDTFAAPLCEPGGSAPSIDSQWYVLNGSCTQMQTLTRTESWSPTLADSTAAGSVTMQTQRTAYGIVIARATIAGRPVVYTNLRSTYMHELDAALGFERFNEPAQMRNPQAFFNAANLIGYTFNWFYTDDKHIAYFNSGSNPVRAAGENPLFPTWTRYGWKGYDPATLTEQDMSEAAHPHTIDQTFLTSWNNKQASGYNDAATGQQFSSLYRSMLLDRELKSRLAGVRKLTLADVINSMGDAGTEDLRGVEVLPYVLQIIGHPTDPALAHAVSELTAWVASGAHRINREHPGATGSYDQGDAVRIMDAWWPLLVKADFGPVLGASLLTAVEASFIVDDEPSQPHAGAHTGSAFDVGFYGVVQKDLRAVLGRHVAGALNRVYCGNGSLPACRAALDASLSQAIAETPQQVYPGDKYCAPGDQMCADSIRFRALGAVTQPGIEWVNRPTFQQAVEIQGHGPRQ